MVKSLQGVMGAVPSKMPMPSLSNLYFRLKDKSLQITATDLEVTVSSNVDIIESEGEGSILIQAKRFNDLVRELPDVPLEVKVQDPFKVTLDGEGVGIYTLPGGDPVDFPELPTVDSKISFTMKGDALRWVISKTSFAVSHDEMRPILTGILMQIRTDEICLVATDGHRLSRVIHKGIDYRGEPRDVVVPMKALTLLMRSLDDTDEPVLGIAETRASFTTEALSLTTRLIDGYYPNYESVIPKDNPHKMTVNTSDFMAVMRRVSIFANQISHQVRMTIDPTTAVLESEDPELGSRADEKLAVNYDGTKLEIAYNSNYLMDVLRQVDTDEVVFTLKETNDAALIQPTVQGEGEDLLMLLMPIRLK